MSSIETTDKTNLAEFEQKINEANKLFCMYQTGMESSDMWRAQHLLEEAWSLSLSSEEKCQCIEMAVMFREEIMREYVISQFAFDAYKNEDYDVAGYGFMRATQLGSKEAKNNFAYMTRKRLYRAATIYSPLEILKLLKPGMVTCDTYSILNAALVFCIMLGTEKDWEIADKLVSCLQTDVDAAMNWWKETGEKGDPEGYLVHLFMLRHQLIQSSPLGEKEDLWVTVHNSYPNVPLWLKEPAAYF